ncbi:hypothetical protein ACJX0J_019267, partial [Zea mays]
NMQYIVFIFFMLIMIMFFADIAKDRACEIINKPTNHDRICHGEIYSCDLFVLCILSCLNECGKIDRLMDPLNNYRFTQLVITEISSLDIIKIKTIYNLYITAEFMGAPSSIYDSKCF